MRNDKFLDDFLVTLPYPPSVNDYYGDAKHGKYLKPKARKFLEMSKWCCWEAGSHKREPFKTPVLLQIAVFRPDWRVRDGDNLLKGIQDGLKQGGVYSDDSLCWQTLIHMLDVAPKGGEVKCLVSDLRKFNFMVNPRFEFGNGCEYFCSKIEERYVKAA